VAGPFFGVSKVVRCGVVTGDVVEQVEKFGLDGADQVVSDLVQKREANAPWAWVFRVDDPRSSGIRASLLPSLLLGESERIGGYSVDENPFSSTGTTLGGRLAWTYTIFEGTSEIQRLVIARAISGLHIQ
jgi:hypothetical protein